MLNNFISIIAECQRNTEKIKQLFIDPLIAFQLLSKNGETFNSNDIKQFSSLNDEEINYYMSQFSSNDDTKISCKEFIQSLKTNNHQNVREALIMLLEQEAINFNKVQALKENGEFDPIDLFHQIDQSNRGYLTSRTVSKATNLSYEHIQAFFKYLGKDICDKIFMNEFLYKFKPINQHQLASKYLELRKSQEKEKKIIEESKLFHINMTINEEKFSQQRNKQIQQLIQSRNNLERAIGQISYPSLVKVRQQLLQIDYVRRNSQRDSFERVLKYQYSIIKNLKDSNAETNKKQKNLSELHDQLYTMRTQQDQSQKRQREFSMHSQSQL